MESYPRQRARTRGFRLGVPRGITPAPDGTRVVFVRSSSGTDPIGDLWVLDIDTDTGASTQRRVIDARALLAGDDEDLPSAERARRERLREVGEGIATFTTDARVTRAAFALAGRAFVVDLVDPLAWPVEVAPTGIDAGVVDPRISPDGTRLGFVAGGALVVVPLDLESAQNASDRRSDVAASHVVDERFRQGGDAAEPLEPSSTVTWGLADFIAAEEFSRMRGWWWVAEGGGVIIERVDESPVETWWIADPANPSAEPREHRYPSAGSSNADVSLWLLDLDADSGTSEALREIIWDHDRFPYLTGVHIGRDSGADPIVSVLSRDQRHQQVLRVDASTASTTVIAEHHDDAWVDVIPGVPVLDPAGRLIEIRRDSACDTDRVFVDGVPLSPEGFQVRGVGDIDADSMIVDGSHDPIEEIPVLAEVDGRWHPLVDSGIGVARRAGSLICLTTAAGAAESLDADDDAFGSTTLAGRWDAEFEPVATIANLAAKPVVSPRVHLSRTGEHDLPTAVLWPSDHVPGSRRLPVLLAPYGGPHARRVVDSRMAFATDQWWADQGFCVVIADGRGTPGRGPAWERAVLGDLAEPTLADQISALDAVLAAHPDDTDPDRVGIHGWSFGGYLAALAVLRAPERIHVAVAGAPVTEWRLYDTAYTERYLGDPATHSDDYDRCSMLLEADRLERPLLLVHGLADDNVVVAHTLQFSSALLAAGRAHSVLPLSGVTHMTPQEVIAENLLLAQRDFLLGHLG